MLPASRYGRYAGVLATPVATTAGALAGRSLGPDLCHNLAGIIYLAGFGLLLAAARTGALAPLLLAVYAVLLIAADPSVRYDGNARAAAVMAVVWLAPALAGGVTMPRRGQWAAAVGCWCLAAAVSMLAGAAVYHLNVAVGLLCVVRD